MHEYGHYVVWSYNDVSNTCTSGLDEGDAVDETVADLMALIFVADDGIVNTRYDSLDDGPFGGQFPGSHGNAALVTSTGICSTSGSIANHLKFQNFEQAFWEVLWNRDCQNNNCSGATSFANHIWATDTQEQVIDHMGDALGFALKTTGTNVTMCQILVQMQARIGAISGGTVANKVRAVFNHHGFVAC